ncbi:TrkH family potassium uptake protein [Anaerotignum sp. MB30-C6]|uniref:TrkH family potassium uptake protein n=1 Tax=Anaerotignum sp. MB30-C6 TaxID=3070814 RepID=UPI0027DE20F9|nr:potassium transporter TrkG [Anaerotignum sp. MB30-C6]WMI80294.1 potassium transporter TrkG [Anaerotignum sp. MB30-C6]
MFQIKDKLMKHLVEISPMKIILYGYCFIILLGAILLCMPFASQDGKATDFLTAFFTATSATCVTGLVVVNTYTHWSTVGQVIILCLIQIGGIGFMTVCIAAITLTKKKIGFMSRSLMQNSIAAPQLGGIVRMTKFVLYGTLLVEGIGAFLLSFFYCPIYGLAKGIWYSIFHSISAFCNAGFDLMGTQKEFVSFTSQVGNVYVNAILMLLIIVGGLGFFVWHDLIDAKLRFSRMHLHTKLVIFLSSILIVGGTFLLFISESGGAEFQKLTLLEQITASAFQSVSSRTAGFNTVDIGSLTETGQFLIICLMLIGGSPGSTAGGIKTTTFAVLALSVLTTFWHKKSIEVFGRRMEDGITRLASCVFMIYLFMVCSVAMIISKIEGMPLLDTLFESVSAIATVGLTTGITTSLGNVSLVLLAILMITGRAGSLTMLLAFSSRKNPVVSTLPLEKIQIG